jgi:hypothetical protein
VILEIFWTLQNMQEADLGLLKKYVFATCAFFNENDMF